MNEPKKPTARAKGLDTNRVPLTADPALRDSYSPAPFPSSEVPMNDLRDNGARCPIRVPPGANSIKLLECRAIASIDVDLTDRHYRLALGVRAQRLLVNDLSRNAGID
jgi:hypothetical protein